MTAAASSTNKRHKSFGGHKKKAVPLSFDIEGEEFECYPRLTGVALIEFAEAATSDDTSRSTGATLEFFKDVMTEEEHERFYAFVSDPKREVEAEELAEIVEWLVEEYTSRPTK